MEQDDDKILLTLRHSRKAFLVEYLCSIFLFSLWLVALLKNVDLPKGVWYLFPGLGFAGIASTELRRYFGDRYRLTSTKLSVIKGVLKIKKKNVYYQPLGFVPDLNIKQSALQRLFGYGTIFLQVGNGNLELQDIDNPHQVLELLENLIEESRRSRQLQRPGDMSF